MKRRFLIAVAAVVAVAWLPLQGQTTLAELPTELRNDGTRLHVYTVQPKETLYSLSNRYGVSIDTIYALNPKVATDGLRAYETICLPMTGNEHAEVTAGGVTHTVKKGETVYGISRQYDMPIDKLLALNPAANEGLKTGMVLTIDPGVTNEVSTDVASVILGNNPGNDVTIDTPNDNVSDAAKEDERGRPSTNDDQVVVDEPRAITIAAVLPFMLSEQKPSKGAQRMTEYFKGMLLAADTLAHRGSPVRIMAYDTANDNDTLWAVLSRPEVAGADIVIAPDSESQLRTIARWAEASTNNTIVVNAFVVRDSAYLTNPRMVQTYTPAQVMQRKAINALMARARGADFVVIDRAGTKGDQDAFVTAVTERAQAEGHKVSYIRHTDDLRQVDVDAIDPDRPVVFLLTSSEQSELDHVAPAIAEWRINKAANDVQLWGYAKWISYRGETLSNMHGANTLLVSRFYADPDSYETQGVDDSFQHWYGQRMADAVPQQGLMGYDTTVWLIEALRRGTSPADASIEGVQTPIELVNDGAGWVNDAVVLVNFRPGGIVDRRIL